MNGDSKKPWASKTIWLAFIYAILNFIPGFQEFNAANPVLVPTLFSGLVVFLRLITKDKIGLE